MDTVEEYRWAWVNAEESLQRDRDELARAIAELEEPV